MRPRQIMFKEEAAHDIEKYNLLDVAVTSSLLFYSPMLERSYTREARSS